MLLLQSQGFFCQHHHVLSRDACVRIEFVIPNTSGDTEPPGCGYPLVVICAAVYVAEVPVYLCFNTQGPYKEAQEFCPGDILLRSVLLFRYSLQCAF